MRLFEQLLSSETLFTGRVFTIKRDVVRLSNGHETGRELVVHRGGVAVLAITGDGRVPMVRQYRYGAGRAMLEIPAGSIEPGEEPEHCGIRELREECGLLADSVESLGQLIPTGAYCSEVIYLYLARGLHPAEMCLDSDEILESETVPFQEALDMAADGRIDDAKTVIALFRAARLLGYIHCPGT